MVDRRFWEKHETHPQATICILYVCFMNIIKTDHDSLTNIYFKNLYILTVCLFLSKVQIGWNKTTSLNLRRAYLGKPSPRPPKCTTPWQPTLYLRWSGSIKAISSFAYNKNLFNGAYHQIITGTVCICTTLSNGRIKGVTENKLTFRQGIICYNYNYYLVIIMYCHFNK